MNKNCNWKIIKCTCCLKEYYVPKYRAHTSKFCSRECSNKNRYLNSEWDNKRYTLFIHEWKLECKRHWIHNEFRIITDKLSPICILCSRENSRRNDRKYWFRNIVRHCKNRALSNNMDFNIDEEFIISTLEKQENRCAISKIEFNFDKNDLLYTPSIDRIDSSKWYIKDNVQILCRIVNRMKTDLKQTEFLEICNKITINNK